MKKSGRGRFAAFLLAAVTGLTAIQAVLPPVAEAASGITVNFIDEITGKSDLTTIDLLMGETVRINKQPSYQINDVYLATPAFLLLENNVPATQNDIFTPHVRTIDGVETITIESIYTVANDTKVKEVEPYNIRPSFNTHVHDSKYGVIEYNTYKYDKDGNIIYTKDKDGNTIPDYAKGQMMVTTDVLTESGISIIEDGILKFTTKTDQEDNGSIRLFEPVEGKAGLAGYNNTLVTTTSGKPTKPGELYLSVGDNLGEGSSGGANKKDLCIHYDYNEKYPFLAGTTITLTFRQDLDLEDLVLRIWSRQYAVNSIAQEIKDNFPYYERYIFFKDQDNPTNISQDFELKQYVKAYNYVNPGFRIDWDWEPENPSDQDCIVIPDPNSNEKLTATVKTKALNGAVVKGNLVAKVFFEKDGEEAVSSTTEVKIPITLQRVTPSFKFTSASYYTDGSYMDDTIKVEHFDASTDTYKMDIYKDDKPSWPYKAQGPYRLTGILDFGRGSNEADKIWMELTCPEDTEIEVLVDGQPHNLSEPIAKGTTSSREVKITAKKIPISYLTPIPHTENPSEVKLNFRYYAPNGVTKYYIFCDKSEETPIKSEPATLKIYDNSPNSDATMKEIGIKGFLEEETSGEEGNAVLIERFKEMYGAPNGKDEGEDYYIFNLDRFSGDKLEYNMTVPSIVESIKLKPTYNAPARESKNGQVTITYPDWENLSSTNQQLPIEEGGKGVNVEESNKIYLAKGDTTKILVKGIAEDGTVVEYTLKIKREVQTSIYLKELKLITEDDGIDHIDEFNPFKFEYPVTVPYSYRSGGQKGEKVTLKAVAESDWARGIQASGNFKEDNPIVEIVKAIIEKFVPKKEIELQLNLEDITEKGNSYTVAVKNEAGDPIQIETSYKINVTVEPPDTNNYISQMEVYRKVGREKEQLLFDNPEQFQRDDRDFYLTIPYSTNELDFEVLPDSERAGWVKWEVSTEEKTKDPVEYVRKGTPLTISVDVSENKESVAEFDISFYVQAEDESWTKYPYVVHVTREAPDENADLFSMTVTDATTGAPVENYSFNPQQTEYDISVPYQTSAVVVSPAAASKLIQSLKVDGMKITDAYPGKKITLKAGKTTTVTVEVVPESSDPALVKKYILKITRENPSKEARLLKLEVTGAENMTPKFTPSGTNYTIDVPEKTESFTVTPTPVDPRATITVNGAPVAGGTASGPIVTTKGNEAVKIVVTAEDGKTKKTYTLNVRNYNFLKKSDDATLTSIYVNYGDLAPDFRSNVEEYELYVKPTAMSLELTPELANRNATMKVYAANRQIASRGGVYATSLLDDKTEINIDVTAEDGTKKTYTITVYRNDEEKQGDLKPITAESVDFTEDPIVIDITKYSIIDASVFNTMKTEYPDKTILFQGNDYTLQMKGSDITGLVPYTQTYDFYFSYTSPEEDLIQDALWDIDSNSAQDLSELRPLYLHFDHHGALPGRMLLTVNLGREYSNSQLFWNYYNSERDRIDYYGYVMSNAKGGFTVPLTHLSTYFVTKEKILGAENKVNVNYGGVSGSSNGVVTPGTTGDGIGGSGGKRNPSTGVWEEK